jgi:hypothetical protein
MNLKTICFFVNKFLSLCMKMLSNGYDDWTDDDIHINCKRLNKQVTWRISARMKWDVKRPEYCR